MKEFEQFSSEHEDLRIELSAEGELILMPAVFSLTAAPNSMITGQLQQWAQKDSRSVVIDSSGGFVFALARCRLDCEKQNPPA
jgi:Uma2 family endonuclease